MSRTCGRDWRLATGDWRLTGTADGGRATGKGGVIPSAGEESRSDRKRGLSLDRDDRDSSPPRLRRSARNDGSHGPRLFAVPSRQSPVASPLSTTKATATTVCA